MVLVSSLLLVVPSTTRADEDWIIDRFSSNIVVEASGTTVIRETIDVDFGSSEKHGIFRDIPYTYQSADDETTYTNIQLISITNNSREIPHEIIRNNSVLRFKVGDPETKVTGKQRYEISYRATGILRGYPSFDEIYWNVTGNGWPVIIKQSEITVTLPSIDILQTRCYQGPYGSTDPCQTSHSESQAHFSSVEQLVPGEGITVAASYPTGVIPLLLVHPPTTIQNGINGTQAFASGIIVILLGCFVLFRRWWSSGRDLRYASSPLRISRTVVPEFTVPGNLRPGEIGMLLDEKADTLDVSATLVDLAIKGYLTIHEIPKKWMFGKTDYQFARKSDPTSLLPYEKKLLNSLFASRRNVKLSELKYTFYDDLAQVKAQLYQDITAKKFFYRNPQAIRTWHIGFGIGLLIIGVVIAFLGIGTIMAWVLGIGVGLSVVGILTIITAPAMPARTASGRSLYHKILGYKLFLGSTEKYRQPFLEKENYFMQVLPYAMVFGVTKKLAEAFQSMDIAPTQPTWYIGTHPFSPTVFASDVTSFSKTLSSAMAVTPGSSGSGGSGFSGGGFGGGGGGSW